MGPTAWDTTAWDTTAWDTTAATGCGAALAVPAPNSRNVLSTAVSTPSVTRTVIRIGASSACTAFAQVAIHVTECVPVT